MNEEQIELKSKKQIKKLRYIGSYFDKDKMCYIHIFKRFRKVYRFESDLSLENLEEIKEQYFFSFFRIIDKNHKYLFDLELTYGVL